VAYRARRTNPKRPSSPKFRIIWEVDGQPSRHVKLEEWGNLGIKATMSFEEVAEITRHLNAQINIKKQESRRNAIHQRLKQEALIESAYLPGIYVQEFETSIMPKKRLDPVFWRTAQRVIREINIPPCEWEDTPEVIYNFFESKNLSLDYTKKVIRVLNQWGRFLSKKKNTFFLPVPHPITFHRERINDSYYEKNANGKAASPLTPEQLLSSKNKLTECHYNWLYISVWLGLRPQEIDGLKNASSWKLTYNEKHKLDVLWIYQSKLKAISKEKRWKLIPLKYKEQKQALQIIKSQQFNRPLVKTITRVLGDGYYLYSGRKGFTDLMLNKNHSIEEIASWLGHKSIKQTWESYKNRLELTYKNVG